MARLSVPTKAKLPSSLRVESSNPAVIKSLGRLSRSSLISLALDWLDESSLPNAVPYLVQRRNDHGEPDSDNDDPDDLYPPCRSLDDLRALYTDMQTQKGAKRDVVTRILEGDWRHGLTLYQLAMVDFQHLDHHPTSQKWTAYAILPLKPPSKDANEQGLKADEKSLTIPRFHPSTFLQNFQQQLLPDVKAHYHFYRPKHFPVLLLRVFVIDSPYNTNLALTDAGPAANFSSSRTVYLAFPDGSPSLYITKSQATGPVSLGESKSLRSLIVNGVPKALSRPRERFTLKSTNLSSKNLDALLDKRGSGRANAAGGGWSIYADEKAQKSPLDPVLPGAPIAKKSLNADRSRKRHGSLATGPREGKRARLVAKARFGDSAIVTDGKGVEKVEILVQDPFPASNVAEPQGLDDADDEQQPQDRRRSKLDAALRQAQADVEDIEDEADASRWTPAVRLCFQGSHVFAGLRQLVEAGIVDGERMPGWMTGEEGVTTGALRHGRIRGHKGSGL
ncbi:kinetochore protein CHL4 like domain-containing protein [Hirsutella rhossiliensis]|uniref:Kinetochore protein CHL4 like domain-containing protein n=1 Tax=Hirsutella rhossiliensis TaxID=111463 RepID=A0A9P8N7C8_9HYPO|nr:kinetochore protein CHL4 like domain-containing protein [Hirsutella rhossiliensis]KAH0967109.1 kinetochore protein CHL4 like domain-containing protein [Hirsutella rhossiliensis]